MTCEYTLNGPDGQSIKLVGKPALKAYLATGNNLARLLPVRAAVLGLVKAAAKPAGVQFSRSAQIQASAKVEANVSAIKASWANAPDVVVAFDMQDPAIPESVRLEDQYQRSGGAVGTPEGFYLDGKVYLIASQLKTPQDTARVLFHEALGHYGLRGVFGPSLKPILEQITALRRAEVIAKARGYGLVKKGVDVKKASASEIWNGMTEAHKLQAAEEVLAEMAQSTPTIGFVQRAIAAIRTWLRQHVPSFNAMKLSDAEIIRSFIEPARAFVERGSHAGKVAAETVAFQRAYHGTPHRGIEKFSTENIGTGEGAQAYGWGLYFASKRDVADWYRKQLSTAYSDTFTKGRKTLETEIDLAKAYFTPERIIRGGFGGSDKVLKFERMDGGKWWEVQVIKVDNDGNPKQHERPRWHSTFPEKKQLEDALKADGWTKRQPGQLYEVEIPEDSDMLLWNKPLSEQPAKVRKALAGLLPKKKSDPSKMTNEELADAIMAADRDADTDGMNRQELLELADTVEAFSMADQINRDPTGLSIYHDLEARFDSDKAASEALMAKGIKGIKYLDGTSHGANEGSHNYVIFSGDDVAIQSAMFSRSAQTEKVAELPDGYHIYHRKLRYDEPLMYHVYSGLGNYPVASKFDEESAIKAANEHYQKTIVIGNQVKASPSKNKEKAEVIRFYHGSHEADLQNDGSGRFGGLFTSTVRRVANNYGNGHIYYADIPENKVMGEGAPDVSDRKITLAIRHILGDDYKPHLKSKIWQMVVDDIDPTEKSSLLYSRDDSELEKNVEALRPVFQYVFPEMLDSGNVVAGISWAAQKVRGMLAKELGYQAVAMRDENGLSYLVLPGVDIKNDAGEHEDDVRFSRSSAPPEPPQGLKLPDQNLLRRVQAAVQDSMNRVRQVQDRIEAITGKKLSEYADYYGAETNRPGRIAARKEDARNNLTGPLMEKLAKSGHTMEQLSELLHAMHAEERNKSRGKLHPEESNFFMAMTDHSIVGASGMSTDKANQIKLRYGNNRALHKLADDARSIARATLDMKRAYGLIDSDTYESLTLAYENYVPLKGEGESGPMKGQGVYGPQIKSAIGHNERDEHILEHIARDHDQTVVAGEKNLARQSLLSMVLENPDPKLWTVGVPPKGRYVAGKTIYSIMSKGDRVAEFTSQAQVSAFLEDKGKDASNYDVVDSHGDRVQEFTKPLQDHEVMVYVDGKPVRIQIVGDESLARQLRPLDQGQMNPILELMRTTNRYLSKIYTGYNPAFIIRNTVRDATTGTVTILGNQGVGTAAKAWANYPAAMAALSVYAATGKAPEGDAGNYLHEYRDHGGKTGASYMSDLEEQGKSLQRAFDDAKGAGAYLMEGKSGKAAIVAGRKIVGGMAHVVEVMNQATENSLRLALFMALRKQGISPGEAAQAAKRVTVDFDRKGSMTGALGAIYLFFNPAVQGTANALKMLGQGEHKEQAWMALGTLAALGAYAASQGIDDDKDRWLGESWESRSKNLIIKVGSSWIKVPISHEFSPFYAAGMAMEEAKRGESAWVASGRVVSSFLSSYIPLSGIFQLDSDNHGLDAAMALTPTLLKPSLQMATNRNSFGSQVMPDNELTKDRPDNLKMFRGTKGSVYDATAQGIAKAGEALGARRYENDLTKVSPETLKMMWRTYTGGLGQFVTDMAGMANIATSDRLGVSDVPIAKDFVKDSNTQAIRGRFYNLAHEVQQASTEFQQARKAGDGESIDAILAQPDRSKMLGLNKLIKATTHAAATVRDEMVSISADQKLSLAEKRAKLKQLEKVEEDIYRGALGAFK